MIKHIDAKELLSYEAESLVEYVSALESEINYLAADISCIEAKYKEMENKNDYN